MIEEWKPVVGYENEYEVSSLGRVRSLDRTIIARGSRPFTYAIKGRIIKQCTSGKYPLVTLSYVDGLYKRQRPVHVHKLVAEAFIGPRPDGTEVCHDDGVKSNNDVSNLRYDTHKNNEADKERHGTRARGETHSLSKLKKEDVREIRLLAHVDDDKTLAEHYGVTKSMVNKIIKNEFWHDPAYVQKQRRVLL